METVIAFIFLAGMAANNTTPSDLTDACKAQTVKSTTGNYSYVSYDHCAK